MRATPAVLIGAILLASVSALAFQGTAKSFDNSLVLTPLYVEYLTDPPDVFSQHAAWLKETVGSGTHLMLGFAAYLSPGFPAIDIRQPLTGAMMASTLSDVDTIVARARQNGIVTHVSIISGFFHTTNALRQSALLQDVRNAQWFADGWIGPPAELTDAAKVPISVWITPSRYAHPLRDRIEEGIRLIGSELASQMAQYPDTLMTVSGDGEVELSFQRNFTTDGEATISTMNNMIYTDYSPFAVAEFRDSLRNAKYKGDLTPATDDDGDGHTFDADFNRQFSTWQLQYFNDSGPIPYSQYLGMAEKLPSSGPYFIEGGFDAPRTPNSADPYWQSWIDFRKQLVGNYLKDFATWITTTPDPVTGFTIPPSRFFTHQIPGDFIFGENDSLRLRTSASYLQTAVIQPLGGTGVTAFDGYDGKKTLKTATPMLFSSMFKTSRNWGVLEYNPSMPYANRIAPNNDIQFYLGELGMLYTFRPHVIVPFAYSHNPDHKRFSLQGSVFEKALHQFVLDVGDVPWFSWQSVLN